MQIEARPEFLRVHARDGERLDFHWFWLRHNCDCCRHPQTRERTLCSSRVPLDLRPLRVAVIGDGDVEIAWDEPGGHVSRYARPWLETHAYARDRADVPPPSGDLTRLELSFADLGSFARLREASMVLLAEHGAVVVRGAGTDTERIIAEMTGGGLALFSSHFGRIEDLRTDNSTNANTDQLGYTDAPVDLHTDQPFITHPPRYQILHCMRPADAGGDNKLVDARQAARHLASIDVHAHALLTTVPVRFHRVQREFESLHVGPVLELRDGAFFRVRSSYFTTAPHRLPFAEMAAYYRAYARFAAIVNAPENQVHARLASGDFLLYDNFRTLHARTGFTGARWMRGVYFDDEASRRGGTGSLAPSSPD